MLIYLTPSVLPSATAISIKLSLAGVMQKKNTLNECEWFIDGIIMWK
jgi:hypothetical protein